MENVSFDPGFTSCMLGVSDNVEFMYSTFVSSAGSLKQKKFQFSILFPKIKIMLKQNIGFYLGCLLWASCIKQIQDGMIDDNPCYGSEYSEEISEGQVKYLINFVETELNRDAKYYINKPFEPDERYLKILNTYLEFIRLNKGFIETKNTSEIKLPDCIKKLSAKNTKKIQEKIQETLQNKDLTMLYDVYDLILD